MTPQDAQQADGRRPTLAEVAAAMDRSRPAH